MLKKALAIALLLTSHFLFSQSDFDINYLNEFRKVFTFQPIFYPTESADSIEVIVPFKFSLSYLTFERAENDSLSGYFLMEFVFRDTNGVIKKTVVHKNSISFPFAEKELVYYRNYVNHIQIRLPFQKFSLEVSLFDKEKTKIKTQSTNLAFKEIDGQIFFPPISASKKEQKSNIFELSFLSNALDFTKKDKVIIIPVYATRSTDNVNFRIKSTNLKSFRMNWQKEVDFEVKPILLSNSPFSFVSDSSTAFIYFEQRALTGGKSSLYFLLLEFPEEYAYLQEYIIMASRGNLVDTLVSDFKITWNNPPLSLRNIQYAIDLMYYIIPDSLYESLLSLKKEQQWQRFFEYWRKFDTDTTTLYNEAMDEYYKRVDYAIINFQTVAETDGAKTERGKIFILYGKPSEVQRTIEKDGSVIENWIYYRLKKKFTFMTKFKKFELVNISDL